MGKDRNYDDVDYTQLTETDHGFIDSQVGYFNEYQLPYWLSNEFRKFDISIIDCTFQFIVPPTKVPWKAISLATMLFLGGTIMLVVGTLILTGHLDSKVCESGRYTFF